MRSARVHEYRGWAIEGFGGFCTARHFWAEKDGRAFWRWRLREAKHCIDAMEDCVLGYEQLPQLYTRQLY